MCMNVRSEYTKSKEPVGAGVPRVPLEHGQPADICAPTGLVRERPPVGAVDPERLSARGLRNATEPVGPAQ
jgi:hypothetical protein